MEQSLSCRTAPRGSSRPLEKETGAGLGPDWCYLPGESSSRMDVSGEEGALRLSGMEQQDREATSLGP